MTSVVELLLFQGFRLVCIKQQTILEVPLLDSSRAVSWQCQTISDVRGT